MKKIQKQKIKKYTFFLQSIIFCILLALMGYFSVFEHFKSKEQLHFDEKVTNYAKIGAQEIEKNIAAIHSVTIFGKYKEKIGKQTFDEYIKKIVSNHKSIKNIYWVKTNNNKNDSSISYDKSTQEITIKFQENEGVAIGVLDANTILEEIIEKHNVPAGIDIFIIDELKNDGSKLISYHKSRTRNNGQAISTKIEDILQKPFTKVYQNISKNRLAFVFKPVTSLINYEEFLYSISAGFLMALLSLLASFYIHNKNNQNILIEEKVKKRTKELFESEERYKKLVETSPFSIIVHQNKKISFSNNCASSLIGETSSEELIGKSIDNFISIDDIPSQNELNAQEAPIFFETKLKRNDGKIVSVEIANISIFYKEKLSSMLIMQDITRRKKAEDRLIQREKLANIGELTAGITHELNQPLNIINMSADGCILKAEKQKLSIEYALKKFDIISSQCSRINDIIKHMRGFSHKDNSDFAIFSIMEAIYSSIFLAKRPLKNDNIKLNVNFKDGEFENLKTKGIRVQIEQVIINLINNARDAIIEKRKNTNSDFVGNIDFEMNKNQNTQTVLITIKDNGTGIKQENLNHMFDPFFTTKDAQKGTGLGLSISYDIINRMGGELDATNTENGAMFTIKIPYFSDKKHEDAQEPVSPDRWHIIVADDEVLAANEIKSFLEDEGYRVTVASDGLDAFEKFCNDPADILISDINMPNLDGGELADKIFEIHPKMPIIFITADLKFLNDYKKQNKNIKIMQKPIDIKKLENNITEIISTITANQMDDE
jgi:PAS domain S-box-containing protein